MCKDKKPLLQEIKKLPLNSVEFADGLDDAISSINDNFSLLANYDFTKGERGNSVTIKHIDLSDSKNIELKEKLKTTILDGNEPKEVNVTWDSLLSNDLYVVCELDVDTENIISSLYYTFIDARFYNSNTGNSVGELKDEIDLSCILTYNGENFEKLNTFPTMYYEHEKGLCWKINGNETGVPVQGIPGTPGKDSNMQIVKTNTPNDIGVAVITHFWTTDDGWKDINELSEELSSYDGRSCFVCSKNDNEHGYNSDSTNIYLGTMTYEEENLSVVCSPELSLQSTFAASHFINVMQNISLIDNAESVTTPRGLFIPMKPFVSLEKNESQPIHLISASSINNEEDNTAELMSDMILTPVSNVELNMTDDKTINVNKYMYLNISDELRNAIYPGFDGRLLKYHLTNIIKNGYLHEPHRRKEDNYTKYRIKAEGAFNEKGEIVKDNIKTLDEYNELLPKSYKDRINGYYQWTLCTTEDSFDPEHVVYDNVSEDGTIGDYIDVIEHHLNYVYTTSMTPGVGDDVLLINDLIIDSVNCEEEYPELDSTTPKLRMMSYTGTETTGNSQIGDELGGTTGSGNQTVIPDIGDELGGTTGGGNQTVIPDIGDELGGTTGSGNQTVIPDFDDSINGTKRLTVSVYYSVSKEEEFNDGCTITIRNGTKVKTVQILKGNNSCAIWVSEDVIKYGTISVATISSNIIPIKNIPLKEAIKEGLGYKIKLYVDRIQQSEDIVIKQVEPPVISPLSTQILNITPIRIECPTENVAIFYRIDNGLYQKYEKSFTLDKREKEYTITAYAKAIFGNNVSDKTSHTYKVLEDIGEVYPPTFHPSPHPSPQSVNLGTTVELTAVNPNDKIVYTTYNVNVNENGEVEDVTIDVVEKEYSVPIKITRPMKIVAWAVRSNNLQEIKSEKVSGIYLVNDKICSNCGTSNKYDATQCTKCGKNFDGSTNGMTCWRCGNITYKPKYTNNYGKCWYCGATLDTTNSIKLLRGVDFKSLTFNKFIPMYDNSHKVDNDTTLNLNYNVNVVGDDENPVRNLTVYGSVNSESIKTNELELTGGIKGINTEDAIKGKKGISLAKGKFEVDEIGNTTTPELMSKNINTKTLSAENLIVKSGNDINLCVSKTEGIDNTADIEIKKINKLKIKDSTVISTNTPIVAHSGSGIYVTQQDHVPNKTNQSVTIKNSLFNKCTLTNVDELTNEYLSDIGNKDELSKSFIKVNRRVGKENAVELVNGEIDDILHHKYETGIEILEKKAVYKLEIPSDMIHDNCKIYFNKPLCFGITMDTNGNNVKINGGVNINGDAVSKIDFKCYLCKDDISELTDVKFSCYFPDDVEFKGYWDDEYEKQSSSEKSMMRTEVFKVYPPKDIEITTKLESGTLYIVPKFTISLGSKNIAKYDIGSVAVSKFIPIDEDIFIPIDEDNNGKPEHIVKLNKNPKDVLFNPNISDIIFMNAAHLTMEQKMNPQNTVQLLNDKISIKGKNSSIEFYIDKDDVPKIMVTKNNSSSSIDLYEFVNSITIQTDQSEQS